MAKKSESITHPCDVIAYVSWHTQVKSQLSKVFEPALTSVKVMWQQFDENAPKPIQVVISCVYNNNVIAVVQIHKHILL